MYVLLVTQLFLGVVGLVVIALDHFSDFFHRPGLPAEVLLPNYFGLVAQFLFILIYKDFTKVVSTKVLIFLVTIIIGGYFLVSLLIFVDALAIAIQQPSEGGMEVELWGFVHMLALLLWCILSVPFWLIEFRKKVGVNLSYKPIGNEFG